MYNSCFKLLVIISIMEWTDNKTKLLIEEFEKHPCLYNCKLDSYHNRDLRAVSWQRVAEVLGMIHDSKSPYFVEKAIILMISLMQFQVIKLYYSPMTQIYLYLTNHFMEWLLKQMSS